MRKLFADLLALTALCFSAQMSHAQKWGDIKVQFVLGGEIPKPAMLQPNISQCNAPAQGIPSEALVVNPDNRGIANVLFFLDTRKNKLKDSDIHPDLREIPETKPVLDNLNCIFVPHLMIMRAGQTIEVKNSDTFSHNAKFSFFENQEANPVVPANSSIELTFKSEEKVPTKVECNIHPWMIAHVFVMSHPYGGVSDENGVITIPKLPAGVPLDFRIWHESQNKFIQEVSVDGKKEDWPKGVKSLELKEGINDLGKVTIDVSRFR